MHTASAFSRCIQTSYKKCCDVGSAELRDVAPKISAEIKKFANRMETERGVTKVGVASLRSAVKKIVKLFDCKEDFLEILNFQVHENRGRAEWPPRQQTSAGPVQQFLASLGTPKKEKSPQELFLEFLSPKAGKTSEICSHCGMTGHGPATCYKLHPEQRKK